MLALSPSSSEDECEVLAEEFIEYILSPFWNWEKSVTGGSLTSIPFGDVKHMQFGQFLCRGSGVFAGVSFLGIPGP